VSRHVRVEELLAGIEGLALLRHLYDGTDGDAERRLNELRELLSTVGDSDGEAVSEAQPRAGYDLWAAGYDEPGNPVIEMEEPAVSSLLEGVPAGRALDAACGTGRHARRLVDLGHEVIGIDLSPAMLALAADKVPEADFHEGDLTAIAAASDEFDLVVCGLALAHVPDLGAAVTELSRVLRSGGQLIVSVLHPFQTQLGWHAPFIDGQGARRFVREHAYGHGEYFDAFVAAGLDVTSCLEPRIGESQLQSKRRAFRRIPEATQAAYLGLPGVLVWGTVKR
jgi:ubiquinone/menaquinone biosynthesis C-methylase UbiE